MSAITNFYLPSFIFEVLRLIGPEVVQPTIISSDSVARRIVILFPVTRSKSTNQVRWDSIIRTANSSDVAALVVIDKTVLFEATDYFSHKEEQIEPDVWIFQRPRLEPTHDSQAFIRLDEYMWILQLHDDDEWQGKLEIPPSAKEIEVFKTRFVIVNSKSKTESNRPSYPDCRAIFSLLPTPVWNRFSQMIEDQGGHVAGSIDSALNQVVRLLPYSFINEFEYAYDNRHWESRNSSKRQLMKLTVEDGWGDLSSVEIALVGRLLDGVAALIYFEDFYSRKTLQQAVHAWINVNKPKRMRICAMLLKKYMRIMLNKIQLKWLQAKSKTDVQSQLQIRMRKVLYYEVILKAWAASDLRDCKDIVDQLLELNDLNKLERRFLWWQRVFNSVEHE